MQLKILVQLLHQSITVISLTMAPTRHQQNQIKYGTPLPLSLPDIPAASSSSSGVASYLQALIPSFLPHRYIDVIRCNGTYDPLTRSVWVTDRRDMDELFRKGFFGKGTLSRSEPTWRERRVDLVKGGNCESKS